MSLHALSTDEQCLLICVSPKGGAVVEVPAELAGWAGRVLTPASPLDPIAIESQGDAVAAFMLALRDGRATTKVRLTDDGGVYRFGAFDRRDAMGCVVVVLTPTNEPLDEFEAEPVDLPVRRTVTRIDGAGQTHWVDHNYEKFLGYTTDEVIGSSSNGRIHPDDADRALESFTDLMQRPGGQTRIRLRSRHKDGRWLWVETTMTNLLQTDDPHILVEAFDLSAEMAVQVALQEREALLDRLTHSLPVGVLHLRSDGEIGLVNERWTELTGISSGADFGDVCQVFAEAATVRTAVEGGVDTSETVRFNAPHLGARHGLLRIQSVDDPSTLDGASDESPREMGVLLTLDDITQAVDFQTELEVQARNDHLTQSLNRRGLEMKGSNLLKDAANQSESVVLLYFDLNGFKEINDSYGHGAGDAVLQATADAIKGIVRSGDLVGRVGGDEFVAVLRSANRKKATDLVERIQADLDRNVGVTASVGISVADPGEDFHSLMDRADSEMYAEKTRHRRQPTSGSQGAP